MNGHLQEIGKRIYELRKHLNMTQKELCEGICTQAYISKIENGSLAIAADILFEIAQRLGVDINYFYDTQENSRYDYLQEVEYQVRELVDKTDYRSLYELIRREEKTPLMQNKRFKQLILWHKAICERHLNRNFSNALKLIDQALSLSETNNKVYSERDIEILVNKANLYLELREYEQAIEIYDRIILNMKKIPYFKNDRIKINLYYNLARVHLFLDNYYETIKYAKTGINLCRKIQSMYGLGQLYFILGRAYEELDNYTQALEHFQKAKFLFELNENDNLTMKTLYNIKDVESSQKSQNI